MKIGLTLPYARGIAETADQLREFESVGLDVVLLPEAYTFDAVSQLGFLAARTDTVEIASSILTIYSRTPALLAMTAAGLDHVSDGRFVLGIGASGPQVVEGFHGVPFDAPLARTRDVVEICRQVWRREPLDHHGTHYDVPLTPGRGGSGLGKPLTLVNHPVRERIPMVLAALGPRNVALAAELFEGWEPIIYFPERADDAFRESLTAGLARRDPDLGRLQVMADTTLLISDDEEEVAAGRRHVREHLALYLGGMGARGKNFYADLAGRYGFAAAASTVQDLYLAGRRADAAAAVPDELVTGVSLVGSEAQVAQRVAAFATSGVTTLNVNAVAATHRDRVDDIARLRELADAQPAAASRDVTG